MPESAHSAPDAAAARSWVWHATVASRAAGKVSVLACVETVVAVALYWWIALRWDTHWPLLTSVFIAPGVLVLGILIVEYCDFSVWQEFKNGAAVPIPLKVVLGMGWSHMPLWHWALLIVALTGLGMLAIAGNARSHKASDNWDSYAQSGMQRDLWLMDKLMRLRGLAAKGFMLLGLGMCLISFPELRHCVPDAALLRLERFYHAQELHEPAPAGQPLQ